MTCVKSLLVLSALLLLPTMEAIPETGSPTLSDQISALADSVVSTGIREGRYTLVSRLFETIRRSGPDSCALAAPRDLCVFFSKIHPVARIADSVQVSQLIELAYNTFTLVDSQAIYLTVGDADTYSAWFLQRSLGKRTDILVVSLPFLIGADYRNELCRDPHFQRAFGWRDADSLPVPPTTADTDSARVALVQNWLSHGKRTPLYFSPTCGLDAQLEGKVQYVGLSHRYSDSLPSDTSVINNLTRRMSQSWSVNEASHGMPPQEEALKNGMIQYLSLAIMMVPFYQRSGRNADLDVLFDRLDPICGNNWRFNALRFTYGSQEPISRDKYLYRVHAYAKAHPDDQVVTRFLEMARGQK